MDRLKAGFVLNGPGYRAATGFGGAKKCVDYGEVCTKGQLRMEYSPFDIDWPYRCSFAWQNVSSSAAPPHGEGAMPSQKHDTQAVVHSP